MRVAAVPSIENEREEEGPLACASMEVGRAASPHWPELGHLQGSTCQACQVRSSGNMPVSSECGLGQSKEVMSWGHAASPGREALGRRHQRGKVWLGQGSRRNKREAGQDRQANQAAASRNSRGFDAQTRFKAGWHPGIKKQALPLPAHSHAAFRFVSFGHGLVLVRVGRSDLQQGRWQQAARQAVRQAVGQATLTSCRGGIECYCRHPGRRVIA